MVDSHPIEGRAVVAVLTYRREHLVGDLVARLAEQAAAVDPPARVVVVDNDPEGSARTIVESLELPSVSYVHEPTPGIAAARNAALDAAHDSPALVFIDDDETPAAGWLDALLAAHCRFTAQAIAGPCVRTYATEPAPWVRAARVFDRRRMPTGTEVPAASTANLLIDLDHVRSHDLRFAQELGISGGSDHLFTREVWRSGGRIVWCDEAVVFDPVPSSRLTGRWTLTRGYRSGNTSTRVDLMLAPTTQDRATVRVRAIGAGLTRAIAGAGRAFVGILMRSPENVGLGAWTMVRGAGMVGAATGHRYLEYRRS